MKKVYWNIFAVFTLMILAVSCSGNGGIPPQPQIVPQENQANTPATVTNLCGNAQLEVGEECDDGNTVDGDGCSHDCRVETNGTGSSNTQNVPSNLDVCTDLYLNYLYGDTLSKDSKDALRNQVESVWKQYMKGIELKNCAEAAAAGDFQGFEKNTTNLRNFFLFINQSADASFQSNLKDVDSQADQLKTKIKSAMAKKTDDEISSAFINLESKVSGLEQSLGGVQKKIKEIADIFRVDIRLPQSSDHYFMSLRDKFSSDVMSLIEETIKPHSLLENVSLYLMNEFTGVLENSSFCYQDKNGNDISVSFLLFNTPNHPETVVLLPKGNAFGGFETSKITFLTTP